VQRNSRRLALEVGPAYVRKLKRRPTKALHTPAPDRTGLTTNDQSVFKVVPQYQIRQIDGIQHPPQPDERISTGISDSRGITTADMLRFQWVPSGEPVPFQ
jgi:hypothetical protein